LIGLAGCGGASGVATRPRSEALPPDENQQSHVAVADEAPDEARPREAPSIPGVHLWCQDPHGRACLLATAALGTGPKSSSALPPGLWTVEDLDDDCVEPTIGTVSGRLSTVFAVQPSGWRDQSGTYLDQALIGDMYQAAGCINDAETTGPIAKISAASASSPRAYLVRVWDGQSAPSQAPSRNQSY
jgi:hypothetical protein